MNERIHTNLDHRLSHAFFTLSKKHWLSRALTVFCAQHLVWVMAGVIIGYRVLQKSIDVHYLWIEQVWAQFLFLVPAAAVTLTISFFVKRVRPHLELKVLALIDPYVQTTSFPSLHSTTAFALATLFWDQVLGIELLICAFIVALSRVAAGVHYFSDIIVGALIGVTVTFISLMGAMIATLFFVGI